VLGVLHTAARFRLRQGKTAAARRWVAVPSAGSSSGSRPTSWSSRRGAGRQRYAVRSCPRGSRRRSAQRPSRTNSAARRLARTDARTLGFQGTGCRVRGRRDPCRLNRRHSRHRCGHRRCSARSGLHRPSRRSQAPIAPVASPLRGRRRGRTLGRLERFPASRRPRLRLRETQAAALVTVRGPSRTSSSSSLIAPSCQASRPEPRRASASRK
jgi:hypothetical protein